MVVIVAADYIIELAFKDVPRAYSCARDMKKKMTGSVMSNLLVQYMF